MFVFIVQTTYMIQASRLLVYTRIYIFICNVVCITNIIFCFPSLFNFRSVSNLLPAARNTSSDKYLPVYPSISSTLGRLYLNAAKTYTKSGPHNLNDLAVWRKEKQMGYWYAGKWVLWDKNIIYPV
jgi:hypothetical protein